MKHVTKLVIEHMIVPHSVHMICHIVVYLGLLRVNALALSVAYRLVSIMPT